jgi:signal peptidase II
MRALTVSPLMLPTARRLAGRVGLLFLLTLLVGCDHVTKRVAKAELEGHAARPLIRSVLDLHYTENTDVAFNLLDRVPERVRVPILTVAGTLAVLALLVGLLWRRGGPSGLRVGLLLVTAGAVGNVLDRVLRGYVVDFIHLHHWPVFNVADIYVTAGGALLALSILRGRRAARPDTPAG